MKFSLEKNSEWWCHRDGSTVKDTLCAVRLCLISSVHIVTHQVQKIQPPLLAFAGTRHVRGRPTYMQAKHPKT